MLPVTNCKAEQSQTSLIKNELHTTMIRDAETNLPLMAKTQSAELDFDLIINLMTFLPKHSTFTRHRKTNYCLNPTINAELKYM